MTIKRKLSKINKVSNQRHHKKHSYYKRRKPNALLTGYKTAATINDLPNETLLRILSYIPQSELYYNVKRVCRRWDSIATDTALWRSIRAPEEIPTEVLVEWIKRSTLLTHLSIINRNDANLITNLASRFSKRLESFEMLNCWGSDTQPLIYGRNLCNLVSRCSKLRCFNFANVKFNSRKFFRLIIQTKRQGGILKRCSYLGPMTAKQLTTLFQTISENRLSERAMVCNSAYKRKIDLSPFLQNPDDQDTIRSLWSELLCPGDVQPSV